MCATFDNPATITGVGLLTPLGSSTTQTWNALLAGQFITDHAHVPIDCAETTPRPIDLAVRAAREAIAQADWSPAKLAADDTALVVGTSKGTITSWITPLSYMAGLTYIAGGLHPTGIAQIASVLADELVMGEGPRMTLSAACAGGLHALIRAAMMLRAGEARRVLLVAVESSVHPLFLASFRRLGILPKPGVGCRPFDHARDGFLMSEAAAAVCLEISANPGIRIDRFALAGDAYHLTGADPLGGALKYVISRALDGRSVDLVHAHGTATPAHDPIELAAIESSLAQDSPPALYSHKGALGHSLGAAGLVAIVLNFLAHTTGQVPPSPQTTHPLPMIHVMLRSQPHHRPLRRSIAIASGFGGALAAISLQHS